MGVAANESFFGCNEPELHHTAIEGSISIITDSIR